ncbi:aminoglycoside phosphotransferase family protein [Pelomyxa schiedti]|nr:aminoglycoside phosphotransferase family protein [Pelomyxa schiedti]
MVENDDDGLMSWCSSVLGVGHVQLSHNGDAGRHSPGQHRADLLKVSCPQSTSSDCDSHNRNSYYLKMHRDPAHFSNEVHVYSKWMCGDLSSTLKAPRLISALGFCAESCIKSRGPSSYCSENTSTTSGVESAMLLKTTNKVTGVGGCICSCGCCDSSKGGGHGRRMVILITDIGGIQASKAELSREAKLLVWFQAGKALSKFHAAATGACFGPASLECGIGVGIPDAGLFIATEILKTTANIQRLKCPFSAEEEDTARRAAEMARMLFCGEQPTPCHRDYCPCNWLLDEGGAWKGVVDFEFSAWDVRATDFARFPEWEWMSDPALMEAFSRGYGTPIRLSSAEWAMQIHISRIRYALDAISWGEENGYKGFVAEGHAALQYLHLSCF